MQSILSNVFGAVLWAILNPGQGGRNSEIEFKRRIKAENEDFGKRKRTVRAFNSSHLSQLETEECDKQWQEAMKQYVEEKANPSGKWNKRLTGGHTESSIVLVGLWMNAAAGM